MTDKDGYPDDRELRRIKKWGVPADTHGLIAYVAERWWQPEWGFKYTLGTGALELHTGGWSGNEEIIGALQQNVMFWALYWQKSERGGHYYFTVRVP